MKINIKRVNVWSSESDKFPQFTELYCDEIVVWEGVADNSTNSFIDGFVCAFDVIGKDFSYEVEDIED